MSQNIMNMVVGISLEVPSISNSRCEKPSISKFLTRNT